jgi:RimJ/RimL family protein N-acetyltransferase
MLLKGKNVNLRTVEIEDAEFIYGMRENKEKTKYLSKISGTVESQREWIQHYKQRENEKKEFYFVIESHESEQLGLVRLYDFKGDSFCWGSWLIKKDAPKTTAIESALQIYEFAFYTLGFIKSHFDVRKGNDKVIAFHQRFGAEVIDENDDDYFFNFEKKEYEITRLKYAKYL